MRTHRILAVLALTASILACGYFNPRPFPPPTFSSVTAESPVAPAIIIPDSSATPAVPATPTVIASDTITPTPYVLTRLKSGVYRVVVVVGATINSTWTLEVTGDQITGSSEWKCCPGYRTDPLSGHIEGKQVIIERDCQGQGFEGACHQVYTGTLQGDTIIGLATGTGLPANTSWTLYLMNP